MATMGFNSNLEYETEAPIFSLALYYLYWVKKADLFISKLSETFWGDTLLVFKKIVPPRFRANLCAGICGHTVLE